MWAFYVFLFVHGFTGSYNEPPFPLFSLWDHATKFGYLALASPWIQELLELDDGL